MPAPFALEGQAAVPRHSLETCDLAFDRAKTDGIDTNMTVGHQQKQGWRLLTTPSKIAAYGLFGDCHTGVTQHPLFIAPQQPSVHQCLERHHEQQPQELWSDTSHKRIHACIMGVPKADLPCT